MAMMVIHVGKQRGDDKCTIKKERVTGTAQRDRESDREDRKRQEETRKVGEKCMGWKRKDWT